MKNLKGQDTERWVLEIAAAGGHNLLMVGPPGARKSMLVAARTSADLNAEATISRAIIAESLIYRAKPLLM